MKLLSKCLIVVLLVASLSVNLCGCIIANDEGNSNINGETASGNIDNQLPTFLNIDDGFMIVQKLLFPSENFQIYSRVNFLIFCVDRYVVRYDIAKNQIDQIIDLGQIDDYQVHQITCSSDGQYIISCVLSPNEENSESTKENYCLIDLNTQSVRLIADCYDEKAIEAAKSYIPESVKDDYYNLSFSVDEVKNNAIANSDFINSKYSETNNIWCLAVDLSTAVLMLSESEQAYKLKDYYIIVIDLCTDRVINEFFFAEFFQPTNLDEVEEVETADKDISYCQITEEETTVENTVFNYSVKKDDMLLEVYAPKKISQYNDFYIVARITNCSDKAVEYSIPVTDNLHKEIVVEIKDENGQKFTDRDTFGLLYDAGMKTVSLEPGEVFNETICFIPGAAKNDFLNPGIENADITYFDEGIYNGIASFSWQTKDESDHSVSVEFTVEIE